jgi:microcystin-dependent protein
MSAFWPNNQIGTGNIVAGLRRRYSFLAFDDEWIQNALEGMVYDYSQVETWTPIGTATAEDAAEYFAATFNTFGVDMATTGVIVPYAGGILPDGWLVCDGRSLVRADYANLFGAIGTVWGAVDSTHFNIPDLRGCTLLGQGLAGSGTTFNLGTYGGEETHTLITSEIPSHSHVDAGHTHAESVAAPNATTIGPGAPQPTAVPAIGVTGSGNANIQNTGGDGPHNNMQPYAVVNYAIIT